ncbi:MAG: DUF559 domain-containing protein [Micrococcales bacterium]|nr:DUF559 domain-containing protein [Micrococcales bacterium]
MTSLVITELKTGPRAFAPITSSGSSPEALVGSSVFTRSQLTGRGLGRGWVAYQVKTGRLVRVAGKALQSPGRTLTTSRRANAAMLTWPDGVVWGPSALSLHLPDAPVPASDRLIVAASVSRSHQAGLMARKIPVPDDEQTVVAGSIRVQSLQAAIVDTLRHLDQSHAMEMLAWLINAGRIHPAEFTKIAKRRKGYRGARRLHWMRAMVWSNAASLPEFDCHEILRQSLALPADQWQANAPVRLNDGGRLRVDVLVAGARKVVEVDGAAYHRDKAADRRRDQRLRQSGYDVLRLDAVMVMYDKARTIRLLQDFLFPDRPPGPAPGQKGGPPLPKAPWWQRHTHLEPVERLDQSQRRRPRRRR